MKLTDQTINRFAKAADDLVDFRKEIGGISGIIAEFSDGRLYKMVLEWLNERYSSKIPDSGMVAIETILNAFSDKNYHLITMEVVEIANEAIDIPYLDEESEGDIIGGLLRGIVRAVERKRIAALGKSVGGGGSGDDPTDPEGNE